MWPLYVSARECAGSSGDATAADLQAATCDAAAADLQAPSCSMLRDAAAADLSKTREPAHGATAERILACSRAASVGQPRDAAGGVLEPRRTVAIHNVASCAGHA
jgi:hypothetical protein